MTPDTDTRWHLDREILLSRAGEDSLVLFDLHATEAGYGGRFERFVEKMYARGVKQDVARPESAITMMQLARQHAKGAGFLRADRNSGINQCDYS